MGDTDSLRQQLSTQLFVGFGNESATSPAKDVRSNVGESGDKCNEKLLLNVRVSEDAKGDEQAKSGKGGRKLRYICITGREDGKTQDTKPNMGSIQS